MRSPDHPHPALRVEPSRTGSDPPPPPRERSLPSTNIEPRRSAMRSLDIGTGRDVDIRRVAGVDRLPNRSPNSIRRGVLLPPVPSGPLFTPELSVWLGESLIVSGEDEVAARSKHATHLVQSLESALPSGDAHESLGGEQRSVEARVGHRAWTPRHQRRTVWGRPRSVGCTVGRLHHRVGQVEAGDATDSRPRRDQTKCGLRHSRCRVSRRLRGTYLSINVRSDSHNPTVVTASI